MIIEPQLSIEHIGSDVHLWEIRIFVHNGRYCGTTEVYISPGDLSEFAVRLKEFPKTISQEEVFLAGDKDGYAFAKLVFCCVDGSGHTAVKVSLTDRVEKTQSGMQNQVEMELRFEPNSLDQFSRGVEGVGNEKYKVAVLNGMNAL